MVGEVFAGLGAIKTAFDMAKGLENIHDAAIRDRAVIELQKEILAAQAAQFALVQRINELEKEVASFETWEADKQKYELKTLGFGAFAYMLRPEARGSEPPHWVCANCFTERKIKVIQYSGPRGGGPSGHRCPTCHSAVSPYSEAFENGKIKWLD